MDNTRLVFDRLLAAGDPGPEAREAIYADCRAEVGAQFDDPEARTRALSALEKVIRRQEMQCLYEDTFRQA